MNIVKIFQLYDLTSVMHVSQMFPTWNIHCTTSYCCHNEYKVWNFKTQFLSSMNAVMTSSSSMIYIKTKRVKSQAMLNNLDVRKQLKESSLTSWCTYLMHNHNLFRFLFYIQLISNARLWIWRKKEIFIFLFYCSHGQKINCWYGHYYADMPHDILIL